MAEPLAQLGVFALPLACVLASASGASMFIAAFVGGIATQFGFRGVGRHAVRIHRKTGASCSTFFVFFLFGLLAAHAWPKFRRQCSPMRCSA